MPLTPTQKKNVRASMADYCVKAEAAQLRWHYTQARPFTGYGIPPADYHANDCSGYVGLVYDWAMHHTGVYLKSPMGAPHGWGYTGTMIDWLRINGTYVPAGKYLVGDIVFYGHSAGATVHTSVCRKAGTGATAIFSSNGNENAPQPTKITYHPDPIVGVYRHPALA
jgi:hypothetical protein